MKLPPVTQNAAIIQPNTAAIAGLTLLLAAAMAGVGVRVHAQSAAQSAAPGTAQTAPQSPSQPAASTPSPPPNSAQSTMKESTSPAPGSESASTPSAMVTTGSAGNGQKQQIDGQCADLLKMANSLKSAVDKTTMDVLSVAVVRQADEIEQLARKMKGELKSTAEK
jgi:hypothetical protein